MSKNIEVPSHQEEYFPKHPDYPELRQALDGNYTWLFQPYRGFAKTELGGFYREFKPIFTRGRSHRKLDPVVRTRIFGGSARGPGRMWCVEPAGTE